MRLTQFASSITLAFLLLIGQKTLGTHIISHDGYVLCLDTTAQYSVFEINMTALRDATGSTVTFAPLLRIGVYGKIDGKLKTIITVPQNKESVVFRMANGTPTLYEATYLSIDTLPHLAGGYVLQFRSCCLPVLQNLINDQGIELLIFVPDNLRPGQHTLKASKYIRPVIQKNTSNSFSYPWTHNLYDSLRFESKDFFLGGEQYDPLPTPLPSLNYGTKGLFNNGASAGNPFGSNGTWKKTSDSTFEVQITKVGKYVYPISTICYLNGDSFMQTILFPAYAADALGPQLWLDFLAVTETQVQLASTTLDWTSIDSLVLQRADPSSPNSFYTLQTSVNSGSGVFLFDSSFANATNYTYRMKLASNSQFYYSNVVEVRTLSVGLYAPKEQSKLQIYPNPAHQSLHLTSPESGTYSLFSSDGKYMKSGELREGENTLTLEDLSPGVYFLRTNFGSAKFIVAHP